MQIAVLGIDLGKNSCSIVGMDETGKVVVLRRMQRTTVMTFPQSWSAASSPWTHAAARIT